MSFTVAYQGWFLALPLVGIPAGFIGRRYRWMRYVLVGLGPLYGAALFVLLSIGAVLAGTDALGVAVIILATTFSLAPILSCLERVEDTFGRGNYRAGGDDRVVLLRAAALATRDHRGPGGGDCRPAVAQGEACAVS